MTDKPNWTEVPNALMELMPYLPEAECRVMLVIARKTHGYHKACDIISYSQLEDATRMSRQGVINGVEAAIKRGILKRAASGFNNGYCYEILADQVVNEVDHFKQSTKKTTERPSSQRSRPQVVNEVDHFKQSTKKTTERPSSQRSSQRSRPQVVNEVDHKVVNEVDPQKKDLKEKKERDVGARFVRAPPPPKQTNMNVFNEAVQAYKELSGVKTIAPVTADKITDTVIDIPYWRKVIPAWIGAGYNPKYTDGMLDWYLHPEKMERKNGTHKPERPATREVERRTELDAYLARLPTYDDPDE